MKYLQAPNGWTDESEHEDDEADYKFTHKGNGQQMAIIYRHDWRGETEWTVRRRMSNVINDTYTIGRYAELSDAVAAAEEWLNS